MEHTPDVQTGRNVYANKDLYESDDTYKAKVDRYVNEGFKLVYGSSDNPSEGGGGGVDAVIFHNNLSYAGGEDPRYNIVYGSYDAVRTKLVGDYDSTITGGGEFAAPTMPVVLYGEESVGMGGLERGARTNYQFASYIRLWLPDEGFVDEEYISIQVNGNNLKWTPDGTIVREQ